MYPKKTQMYQNARRISLKYTKQVPKIWQIYQKCAQNVQKIQVKCTTQVCEICQIHTKDLCRMHLKCTHIVPKMYQSLPKLYQRANQNILRMHLERTNEIAEM